MTGHFSVRHSIRRLLQAEGLEVNTNAAVRDDEVGVDGTLDPSRIITEKKKREHLLDVLKKNSNSLTNNICIPKLLNCMRAYRFLSHSRVALAWQSVTLQARRQRDVVHDVATAATLQTHFGGLSPHCCGRDDDAVNLHQAGHLIGLWRQRNDQKM